MSRAGRMGTKVVLLEALLLGGAVAWALPAPPPLGADGPAGEGALRHRIERLVARFESAVAEVAVTEAADHAHRLRLGEASDEDLEALAAHLQPAAGEEALPSFPRRGAGREPHPAQFTLVLLEAAGPAHVLRTPMGTVTVRDLLEAEKRRPEHGMFLDTARRCVEGRAPAPTREGGPPVAARPGCPPDSELAREDRAWFVEAVALELHTSGRPLRSSWTDGSGRRLGLEDFIVAELDLLALDESSPRRDLLPEFGVHAVGALARIVSLAGDELPDWEIGLRARSSVDRGFERLLFLGEVRSEIPILYKAAIAGHLLELLFSDDVYKPRNLAPHLWSLEAPSTPEEARVLELVGELERFIEGTERKTYGILTHGLRGLRLMNRALSSAGTPQVDSFSEAPIISAEYR